MTTSALPTAVFCHDTWHPAALIRSGLQPLAHDDFSFEWLDTSATWQAPLDRFAFIVLAKGNTTGPGDQTPWLTPQIEDALIRHVHAGKGIVFVHAGTCYRQNPKLRALTGGAFLQHPPPCAVTLELSPNTHPVTRGVTATTLQDEHYEMILDDPQAEVFLHTRSQHGVQPAGWTREENGRICVLTPGHTEAAWADAQFQSLLGNALRWAARKID